MVQAALQQLHHQTAGLQGADLHCTQRLEGLYRAVGKDAKLNAIAQSHPVAVTGSRLANWCLGFPCGHCSLCLHYVLKTPLRHSVSCTQRLHYGSAHNARSE